MNDDTDIMASLTIGLLDKRAEDLTQSVMEGIREYFMLRYLSSDTEIPPPIRDNMDLQSIVPSSTTLVDPEVYSQATKRSTLHLKVSLTCVLCLTLTGCTRVFGGT